MYTMTSLPDAVFAALDLAVVLAAFLAGYLFFIREPTGGEAAPAARFAGYAIAAGLVVCGVLSLTNLLAPDPGAGSGVPGSPRQAPLDGTVWLAAVMLVLAALTLTQAGSPRGVRDPAADGDRDDAGRESEERFRDFAETASDWLWETDSEHRLVWLSNTFNERTTLPAGDIMGKRLWDTIGEENAPDMSLAAYRRHMETQRPIRDFRYSIKGPDGRLLWRRSSARPRYGRSGKFLGYRGATSDITPIVEAESQFRELIESSPDMIFVHRNDRIVYVNPALVSEFGGDEPDSFIDRDTLVLCHPSDHEAIRDRRARQSRGETFPGPHLVHMQRRDGTDFFGETTVAPIHWEGGPAFLVSVRDVTERLGLEKRLRDSEAQYRLLVDLMPNAFFIQCDGGIVFANARAREMFGASEDRDLVGLEVESVVAPEIHGRILQRREKILEHGTAEMSEPLPHLRLDGSRFMAEVSSARIDWNGRPATIALITDVSGRIAAEEALLESESRFRDFAGATSDWFWETGPDLRICWLSETFRDRSGRDPDTVMGRKLWDLDDARISETDSIERCREPMEARKPFRNIRFAVRQLDGTVGWRTTSGQPRFDAAGGFLGFRGSTADITQEIEAERRFQRLIEDSPDAVFVQRDDRIVYVNPALVAMYGAESADHFLGADTLALYPHERHDAVRKRRQDLRAGKPANGFLLHRLVRRDGREFFGESMSTAIEWEGKPAIMVTLRDVTDRILAEKKARESEVQYHRLVELLPVAFVIQCEGRVVYANATARRMFRADEADLVGREAIDLVAPEFRKRILETRRRALATGENTDRLRARLRRLDGTAFESEFGAAPFRWNGKPATMSLITDISDRVAAERIREESEQRFRDFAESTSDWFWETDGDFRFTWFSTPVHPLLGVPSDAAIGQKPWDLAGVDPETNEGWMSVCRDIDARLPMRGRQVDMYAPDGRRYHIALSGKPLFDQDGAFLGYRGSTSDITQQVDTENRLRQAMKMEAIGQLTGGIAHDFNNLLAIISGNLELLAEDTREGDPAFQFIAPALRAAGRGADLTRHLLAFSRQQPLSPRRIDVNRLVDGMTELLRRTMGARIVLETVLGADVRQALADPTQTENAILNLALNARDSMPDGGTLRIATANATIEGPEADGLDDVEPGRYLMIAVSDEGCGIAPDLIDRVFDPFVTTKEVGQGSGLGLSMVYGFVKQSGGHIRISSEPGKGTTVQLYLPEAGADTDTPAVSPDQENVPSGNGETILVVEDDPDVLSLTKVLLTNLNYRVLCASDATAALELLESGATADLLFTDVILPGGTTGVDLARQVGEWLPDIPTIFMSGYSEKTIIHDGVKQDGVMLLDKPFRKADLAQLLHTALTEGRS